MWWLKRLLKLIRNIIYCNGKTYNGGPCRKHRQGRCMKSARIFDCWGCWVNSWCEATSERFHLFEFVYKIMRWQLFFRACLHYFQTHPVCYCKITLPKFISARLSLYEVCTNVHIMMYIFMRSLKMFSYIYVILFKVKSFSSQ